MQKKLLIIGFVWPEPKSSAAGVRMIQLITFFQKNGYKITFATACAKTENAYNLSNIGVKTAHIELNSSSFDKLVVQLQPDIVLFDRFMTEEQFGWRVSENCPNAIKLLDTEDLHFLRRARQQAYKEASENTKDYLFSDTAKREIASIYRCDLSLIISKAERDLLRNTFQINDTLLLYLPFLIDTISEDQRKALPNFEERRHFISIGNFLHEPNYDALLYLKETVWNPIRQYLPNAELHNYGAYASQKVNQLHNEKDGFLIKGFTNEVNEVMQNSKVLLAPIRFGAGLKGKLFDAVQNGTPFVTTSVGAEGVVDSNNQDFICDTTETFIDYAVKLYDNEPLWNEKQVYGFNLLKTQFSKDKFEQAFAERMTSLSTNLKAFRAQNFIGQMLQHHNMQSTKFMSRWIEAKNAR